MVKRQLRLLIITGIVVIFGLSLPSAAADGEGAGDFSWDATYTSPLDDWDPDSEFPSSTKADPEPESWWVEQSQVDDARKALERLENGQTTTDADGSDAGIPDSDTPDADTEDQTSAPATEFTLPPPVAPKQAGPWDSWDSSGWLGVGGAGLLALVMFEFGSTARGRAGAK